jgi:TctA family transporter
MADLMRLKGASWAVVALCAMLAFPSISVAQENYVASEFIEEDIQN